MDKKRIKLIILVLSIIFLFLDIALASLIFSGTVRENDPDWVFNTDSDILDSNLSGVGEAFIYGAGDTIYLHYASNPNPIRSYTLDSGVKSVTVSNDIKSMVAIDMENNLYLFRFGGEPGLLTLQYMVHFDENIELGGLVVIGGTAQTTRILVHTDNSVYMYSSRSDQPLARWDFEGGVDSTRISHYGDIVLVGSRSGEMYVYRTFEQSLEWQCTCDSDITSMAISPFAKFALVGTSSGSVYLYDIEEKDLLWKKSLNSPVKEVFIRSSGSESLIWCADKNAYLFDRDGAQIKFIEGADSIYLSFWGEYVSYSRNDEFFMHREARKSADWKYTIDHEIRYIDSNYGSTIVMLTFKDRVELFYEDQLMVMGSRYYWSLLSIVIIMELFVLGYLFYIQKGLIYDIINNREFLEFIIGALAGIAVTIALSGGIDDIDSINLVIGMLSAGLSSWMCSRIGGGFVGAFSGYIVGLFGSVAIGAAFGIYYWLGGAEDNIISSTLGTAFYGGLLGMFYCLIGVIVGLVIKGYFEEYRRKKGSKV